MWEKRFSFHDKWWISEEKKKKKKEGGASDTMDRMIMQLW